MKRSWKKEEIDHIKKLKQNHSASKVGEIIGVTKNSIMGLLYRDKIRNGYTPPLDSKYTVKKNYL
jgi:hypothetical protein